MGDHIYELHEFIRHSKRILHVTHKPNNKEFKQMSMITAIGMIIIGVIGFVISLIAILLRGGI